MRMKGAALGGSPPNVKRVIIQLSVRLLACEVPPEEAPKSCSTAMRSRGQAGNAPSSVAPRVRRQAMTNFCRPEKETFSLLRSGARGRYPPMVLRLFRVSQNEDDGVAAEKKLRNEAVFVHGSHFFFPPTLGRLRPHFANVSEHQIAVAIESLHAPQYFAVVSAVNQNLRVVLHRRRQHRKRAFRRVVPVWVQSHNLLIHGSNGLESARGRSRL